ncbi:MAG: hypothetical protein DA407_05555 [Bacteroidetes bacterium]|nr:MAG: hypothetical protein DA407_05555 [Bacteroidota bacterium]
MITNKIVNPIIFILFISFFSLPLLCFGQEETGTGTIIYLEEDGKKDLDNLTTITIYTPNGEIINKVIKDVTTIAPGSTIEVPANTLVRISVNDGGKNLEINGYLELEFGSSSYRPTKGVFGKLWAKITKAFGTVTAYSTDKKEHLRTVKTEFEVMVNGEDVNFKLIEGKVAINNRTKVQMEDEDLKKLGIRADDSLLSNNRLLYVTETTKYLTKNQEYNNNSKLEDVKLVTDQDINKFFKKNQIIQRRKLRNFGGNSREGFTMLERGMDSSGIKKYEQAIIQGEIARDEFIESALILTEAYFRKGNLKQRKAWLDAAIHFTKIEDSISIAKVAYFDQLNKKSTANVFLKDQILANEYFAWAYTVKLLINGCLELQQENPRRFMVKAKNLEDQLNQRMN